MSVGLDVNLKSAPPEATAKSSQSSGIPMRGRENVYNLKFIADRITDVMYSCVIDPGTASLSLAGFNYV